MKIIVYGANEIGSYIATEFFEDHDIIVLDPQQENLASFSNLDIATICGVGNSAETLKEAEIKDCDLFIACTNDDESNIVSCMMAKSLSCVRTVCFVSQKECLKSLETLKAETRTSVFVDDIIWPEKLLTKEIFEIITIPEALDVESFANDEARLLEYRIKEDSPLAGKMLKDCNISEGTLVVGIVRNDELDIPNGLSEIQVNDKVIFMGTIKSLNETYSEFNTSKKVVKNVAIIGGGSVGFELARSLEKVNIKVKIIEKDYQRCEFLSENLNGSLVLNGNGADANLLMQESISEADVVICVTDSDEKNLLCSLLVKQMGAMRVITRVGNAITASLFEKVGVDVALSAKEAAVNEIKNKIVDSTQSILATVERGLAEIIEVEIKEDKSDIIVKDVKLPAKAVIAIIMRQNKVIIPNGQSLIRGGDKLVIFTKSQDVDIIREYLQKWE